MEKFIGDAVVGVFGIPVLHEDDAVRAVRAAADLVGAVGELNKDLVERLGVVLAVRIGVNTGEVLSGSGGVALMAGDAANVAARLEQAAGPGEVLIGESTYWLVRDAVDADRVPALSVKGKAEPLVAFRLVGVRPASVGQLRGRRFAGRLVGRARQLQLAEVAYATAVEESACVLLTVVGVPGVGKSRLVQELLGRIGDQAVVLAGRCLPYGEGITYWPTVEMVNRLVEVDPRALGAWLEGVAHADRIRAGLDTMLGLVQAATGKDIAWAFRRLVETVAAVDRPVVLVVDDVQWAEPGLVDLLDHLTDLSRGAPILLVAMARPEFLDTRPTWGAQRGHSFTTVLSPLSASDCAELTAGLLGNHLGHALLERITTAADGIPLFVEEMLAMLVDQHQLEPDPTGGWRPTADLAEVSVPATVHALLAARLDRLAPALREVTDAASVVGKMFYPDAVAVLLDHPDGLDESIHALTRADLIAPGTTDFPGHDAYAFTHLLTRDTAYQALPKARRAVLHEAMARWLSGEARDGTAEVVAFHLEQAAGYLTELGQPDPALAEEAARLLLATADRALALGDAGSAVGLVGRAERLVPDPSRLRAEIALTGSTAANQAGDHRLALQLADRVEHIGAALNDDAVQWRARVQNASIRMWTDPSVQVDDIFTVTSQAIDALTASGDDLGLAMALEVRATAHQMLGQLRAAATDAAQGLRHAHRAERAGSLRRDLLNLVMAASGWGEGSLAEMEHQLEEITTQYGSEPAVDQTLAEWHDTLTAYHGGLGEAIDVLRERSQLALDRGAPQDAADWMYRGVAWCQQWGGNLAGAAETMTTAEALFDSVGETSGRSTVLASLALVLAQLGRDDEARAALGTSRAISADNDRANEILHAAIEGLLLAHQGDSEGSEQQFTQGLRIANLTEFLPATGELWLTRSLARDSLGDTAGALTAAREALACFQPKGFVPMIQTAEARIAELTR